MAIPINEDPYYASSSSYYIGDCDPELDSDPTPRYRPPSIDAVCSQTKFTRKEIQIIYRAFKQGCPNGRISLVEFNEIYHQFFPRGGSSKYAQYVFRTFDRDGDGIISFEEFVGGLSLISRGSVPEKVNWIFTLYDIDNRGAIGHSELVRVAQSMYDLLGDASEPPVTYSYILAHATSIVEKMDCNKDGVVTREEFVQICLQDDVIRRSLELFDTRI